ncbi:hypothetical protein ACFLUD_03105, partial [Chloroflexota bacterium]
IDRASIKEDINFTEKHPIKTRHITEIIETLHKMLNEYCLAFDFSTWSKDLTIEYGIQYVLDAIRFKLQR